MKHDYARVRDSYKAKIVLDSIGGRNESRITTFEIQMPKWLVAEFNTHRMLARNSASSRAIPTTQIIERVMNDPVIPLDFRAKNSGMTAYKLLDEHDTQHLVDDWLRARDEVVRIVKRMIGRGDGVDKQRVNRLLEPWMWTTIVATATEWENFFTLRDHEAAQPEFAYIARLMHEAYNNSVPQVAHWHYPYIDNDCVWHDTDLTGLPKVVGLHPVNLAIMLTSAARCGRVSYYRQGISQSVSEDIQRGLSFAQNKHWSPLEHTASEEGEEWYGPFYGWKSLRKFFPGESGSTRNARS